MITHPKFRMKGDSFVYVECVICSSYGLYRGIWMERCMRMHHFVCRIPGCYARYPSKQARANHETPSRGQHKPKPRFTIRKEQR
jgi:hypothetical protein